MEKELRQGIKESIFILLHNVRLAIGPLITLETINVHIIDPPLLWCLNRQGKPEYTFIVAIKN